MTELIIKPKKYMIYSFLSNNSSLEEINRLKMEMLKRMNNFLDKHNLVLIDKPYLEENPFYYTNKENPPKHVLVLTFRTLPKKYAELFFKSC